MVSANKRTSATKTLDETTKRRIYRRVLKISWTDKIANEEIMRRIGTGREIVQQLFLTKKIQFGTSYKTYITRTSTNRR